MSGYRRCYTLGILNGFSFRENESTRRAFNLLSLEHQELVGAGFCTPDFVLATGELPRGHIGSRSGRARISPSRGVEARPGSRPSRCLTPISLIDTDGVRLGPIDRQVPVRPALGFLRWILASAARRLDKTVLGGLWTQRENRLATDSPLEGDG